MHDDEIVRAGTRRVVGREALRRLSRLVGDWQEEEHEKALLVRRVAIGLGIFAALALSAFFLRFL
jgi:hypothetical protein